MSAQRRRKSRRRSGEKIYVGRLEWLTGGGRVREQSKHWQDRAERVNGGVHCAGEPRGASESLVGADGGGRTHTLFRVPDFESSASADSATSATSNFCSRNGAHVTRAGGEAQGR